MRIFVLFVSRHKCDRKIKVSPQLTTILSYQNVQLNSLDLSTISLDSPLEKFLESGILQNSSFVVSHTSDVMRLLVLWRYGGTYLDLDMIVRQKLDSVPSNCACEDTSNILNGAILNFSHDDEGQKLIEIFINNLIENFNGSVWGSNGPVSFY